MFPLASLPAMFLRTSVTTASVVVLVAAYSNGRNDMLCRCSEADDNILMSLSEDVSQCMNSEEPPTLIGKKPEDGSQLKSAALWRAWTEIMQNWLSFAGLAMLTCLSTLLERAVVTGQVQQIMQLPGQMPFERMLTHVGTLLGLKAIHLFVEGLRTGLSARLGAKLDAAARRIDPSCDPGASGTRIVVVEAAPKLLVEASCALLSTCAALLTSPLYSSFYVAHEVLMGQVLGLGVTALGSSRDLKFLAFKELHHSAASDSPLGLIEADVAFHDAQNIFDRFVDAGQLLVVASFAVSSAALIDKRFLDPQTFQKVVVFVSTAMQSSAEFAHAFDKLDKGTKNITHLLALENDGGGGYAGCTRGRTVSIHT